MRDTATFIPVAFDRVILYSCLLAVVLLGESCRSWFLSLTFIGLSSLGQSLLSASRVGCWLSKCTVDMMVLQRNIVFYDRSSLRTLFKPSVVRMCPRYSFPTIQRDLKALEAKNMTDRLARVHQFGYITRVFLKLPAVWRELLRDMLTCLLSETDLYSKLSFLLHRKV